VKVFHGGRGVGEGAPLFERGDDVHENCCDDVLCLGWRVGEEAVADAGTAVVGAPDYGAGGGVWEDLVESFEDDGADCSLVGRGWRGADAVAGELGDEEGGVRLPGWYELSRGVMRRVLG